MAHISFSTYLSSIATWPGHGLVAINILPLSSVYRYDDLKRSFETLTLFAAVAECAASKPNSLLSLYPRFGTDRFYQIWLHNSYLNLTSIAML